MENKIVIRLPKFSLKFLLLLLCLLFLLYLGFYWYKNIHPYISLTNGYVNAYSTVVSSDTQGRIAEMGKEEGDFVKKGDLLFAFDRESYFAKESVLKSSLQQIEAQLIIEKERMVKAMDGYLVSINDHPEDVPKHLEFMESAQMKAEEAEKRAAAIKSEISLLEKEMRKGAFFAPFDGVILKRWKNEGAVLSFGDPVYTLCDLNRLWIEAEVDERQIQKIAMNTLASVKINAYPNKKFTGKVFYIGNATTSLEKAVVPIKIQLDSTDFHLKPGLSAKIALRVN